MRVFLVLLLAVVAPCVAGAEEPIPAEKLALLETMVEQTGGATTFNEMFDAGVAQAAQNRKAMMREVLARTEGVVYPSGRCE